MLHAICTSPRAFFAAERSVLPITCERMPHHVARGKHASRPRSLPLQQVLQERRKTRTTYRSAVSVRSSGSVLAVAAEPLYEIYVKGAPAEGLVNEKGELGDCELINPLQQQMQQQWRVLKAA